MSTIPDRFPTVLPDYVLVYLSELGDMTLHVEMVFDQRLARAVELMYDAEPILGCRFVPQPWRPYWRRLDPRERPPLALAAGEAEYNAFRDTSIDAQPGPQVTACLWRAADQDHLLLKISHQVSDAGGCKHVAAIVSEIYNRLRDDPKYLPTPNLTGSRSIWQVLRRLPWTAIPRIYLNYLREVWSGFHPPTSHVLALGAEHGDHPAYVLRHLPAERVARLVEYGRARGSTINDLVTAATLRAINQLSPWDGRSGHRINTTADMRIRHLPNQKAEAVCNISGIEPTNLGRELGADFDATLAKVTAHSRARKANYIGLSAYIGAMPISAIIPFSWSCRLMHYFFGWIIRAGFMPNAMTNLGPIPPECVTFDQPPTAAWLISPPIFPPLFGFGISGYAGSLTFSTGTYPPGMTGAQVENVFETICQILPE